MKRFKPVCLKQRSLTEEVQGSKIFPTSPIMLLTCPCTATTLKFDMLRLVYETTFNTPKGIFAEDL